MAATLKDVAEYAGVSIATVSRVLNDPEKVAEQSRSRVLNAIDVLGYSSNLLAKSLRKDGLNAVSVLLPSLSDPFFAQMNQGISDVLATCGYLMITVATEGVQSMEEEYLLKAKSMGLAGVLVYTPARCIPSSWESFCGSFPILFLSDTDARGLPKTEQLPAPWEALGDQVANYFLNQKRHHLVYLADHTSRFSSAFFTRLQNTIHAAGGTCQHCSAGSSLDDAYRELTRYLNQTETLPDVIITQNCYQGAGALSALKHQGIRVPEQAAVLSLENAQLAQLTSPQLSVWGPSGYQVGVLGAQRLLELIRLNEDAPAAPKEEVSLTLIVRGTTDVKA